MKIGRVSAECLIRQCVNAMREAASGLELRAKTLRERANMIEKEADGKWGKAPEAHEL